MHISPLFPLSLDIDEVAIWESALSDAAIFAHSQDALVHHREYSSSVPITPAPGPVATAGAFDLREFAPGTELPTPPFVKGQNAKEAIAVPGGVTLGVNTSCLDQLADAFPAPRWPATPAPRKLGPLSNCMDPRYMAGENQPNTTKDAVEDGGIAIQRVLATKYGYSLFLGNINDMAFEHHATWFSKVFGLVNAMPAVPFEAEIIRANVYDDSKPRGPNNRNALANQTLPDACYLQMRNGTFIDYSGAPVGNATKKRYLRVTSTGLQARLCPDALFDSDGAYFRRAFGLMAQNLTGKRSLIRVWDDGEILAAPCETGARAAYELDPVLVADYDCCSHLPNVTLNGLAVRDWRSYASQWRLRVTARFRDRFMAAPELATTLGTAAYSEFEVEGSTAYFGRWPILREIMTPGGTTGPAPEKAPRHATVDVYVTRPREWDVGAGSWHGLDWLSMVLPSQIASGDQIYTPFVSPGWSAAEEMNVRPAQFLGLLKCAAATGAEWFYTGVFSPADNGLFARSQNWAWVAAMPAYAQATTQLWADLLDAGTLLAGDTPMPAVMWNLPSDLPFRPISYRFWTGRLGGSAPVYMRQSNSDPDTLLLVGTVQPQSSAVGNLPLALNVSVQLPPPATQHRLTVVTLRRQGSVYVLKLGPSGDVSSIVQLDGWHEAWHPSWWTHDVHVEAELHDGFRAVVPAGAVARVHHTEFSAPRTAGDTTEQDCTDFTTFVTARGGHGADLKHTVHPQCQGSGAASTCSFEVQFRLRRHAAGTADNATRPCTRARVERAVPADGTVALTAPTPTATVLVDETVCAPATSSFEWVPLAHRVRVAAGDRRPLVVRLSSPAAAGDIDVDRLALVRQ